MNIVDAYRIKTQPRRQSKSEANPKHPKFKAGN